MADPDYDLTEDGVDERRADGLQPSAPAPLAYADSRGISACLDFGFSKLQYGLDELRDVTGALERIGGLRVERYCGSEALEEVLKGIRSSPRVLHIATHGFFCEDRKPNVGEHPENPLLRCGLALAGANRFLEDSDTDRPGIEDGILTAFEVSGLNLLGSELAVLSACETGIGDVRNGEGVFGLRRAFQLAGTRALLMSMWDISDKGTCALMERFYSNWLSGMSKKRALRQAVLSTIGARREKLGKAHPFFWGAFVLVGDPS
jgi:CHAT domain-containing protein